MYLANHSSPNKHVQRFKHPYYANTYLKTRSKSRRGRRRF